MPLRIPLGVLAALNPNSWIDRLAQALSVVGMAMPTFWFGLLMMFLFGVQLRWLPVSGTGSLANYVMPAIALAYYSIPIVMRLTRAGMIEVLAADYIRTARAKGLLPGKVLFKHALRNAMIPVVAVSAVQFGYLLAGSVVIEIGVCAARRRVPGLAVHQQCGPADRAGDRARSSAVSYVGLVFLADMLNALLDPRIRLA